MKNTREGQPYFDTPVSLIRYFLQGSSGGFVLSMLFASAVSFLDMVLPRIISFTVDSVIADQAPDLPAFIAVRLGAVGGVELLRSHPILIAAAVITVALTGALFRYLFRYLNEVAAERFV